MIFGDLAVDPVLVQAFPFGSTVLKEPEGL